MRHVALALILNLTWLVPMAQSAVKSPPVYQGMPIEAIDIHQHPGRFETMGPLGQEFVLKVLPEFIPDFLKRWSLSTLSKFMLDPYGPFIGIKTECEKAGLSRCGLFAVYAPETWGITSNEEVLAFLQDKRNQDQHGHPYFFGLASVSMQNLLLNEEAELARLRSMLQKPLFKGVKLAFIHNNIPLDDERFNGIYTVAAQFKAPVYHHIGSSPLRSLSDFVTEEEKEHYIASYDPSRLEKVIAANLEVPFILGHMGYDFLKEGYDFVPKVYDLAKRYPNVYLEISAFARSSYDPDGSQMDRILSAIKAEGLIDRTIYGSDGPGSPSATKKYLEATLRSMDRVGYTYDEAEAVLSRNSRLLFQL
jgi:predicted TIM-barrel fold metal-dependent hydrolase